MLATVHTGELVLLFALALALTWLVSTLFPNLKGPLSRFGIVSLELAWTPGRANEIVDAWTEAGWIGRARRSITIDWWLIPCYSSTLALLALLAARAAGGTGLMADANANSYAWALASSMLLAGLLDVVENFAMLQVLSGAVDRRRTLLMSTAAATKFLLLVVGAPLSILVLAISGWKALFG